MVAFKHEKVHNFVGLHKETAKSADKNHNTESGDNQVCCIKHLVCMSPFITLNFVINNLVTEVKCYFECVLASNYSDLK